MNHRRVLAALAGSIMVVLVPASPAFAKLKDVSVGNYWYEDDATASRKGLVVDEGDQIRFTIREPDYPPHSVNIDELDIRSGDLLLFDTYTTPPLKKTGTFRLYCEAHRDRGHVTTLTIRPVATARPGQGAPAGRTTGTVSPSKKKLATASPRATVRTSPSAEPEEASPQEDSDVAGEVVATGRGKATDRRRAPPRSGSLEDLLGRGARDTGPWTSAFIMAAFLALPIGAVTAYAARCEVRRRSLQAAEMLVKSEPQAPSPVGVDLPAEESPVNRVRLEGAEPVPVAIGAETRPRARTARKPSTKPVIPEHRRERKAAK